MFFLFAPKKKCSLTTNKICRSEKRLTKLKKQEKNQENENDKKSKKKSKKQEKSKAKSTKSICARKTKDDAFAFEASESESDASVSKSQQEEGVQKRKSTAKSNAIFEQMVNRVRDAALADLKKKKQKTDLEREFD